MANVRAYIEITLINGMTINYVYPGTNGGKYYLYAEGVAVNTMGTTRGQIYKDFVDITNQMLNASALNTNLDLYGGTSYYAKTNTDVSAGVACRKLMNIRAGHVTSVAIVEYPEPIPTVPTVY